MRLPHQVAGVSLAMALAACSGAQNGATPMTLSNGNSAQHQAGVRKAATTALIIVANGPFILHGIPAEISQAKSGVLQRDGLDANLGYDVFRQFVVTIDYGNARLYLRPNAAFDTPVTVV